MTIDEGVQLLLIVDEFNFVLCVLRNFGGELIPNCVEENGSVEEDHSELELVYFVSRFGKNCRACFTIFDNSSQVFFDASCIIFPLRSKTQITLSFSFRVYSLSEISRERE